MDADADGDVASTPRAGAAPAPGTPAAAPGVAARTRRHAERDLSALVVAIEFTLISVMVGVVLFPLTEVGTALFRDLAFEFWPYLACGLALTLYMWTSVIDHSLTFVGWPMDLGHNLLYIVDAVVLAIQMHIVVDPVGWFATSTLAAVLTTATMAYDLRLIRRRRGDATGPAAALYQAVLAQQRRQVRAAPAFLLLAAVPLLLLLALPDVFGAAHGHWHLALIALQLLAVLAALGQAVRTFSGWTEPIVRQAMAGLEPESVA